MLSMVLVAVAFAPGWRHAKPQYGQGLREALAETGRRTGMGAIELRGQGGELGLGDHVGIGVIGPSHPGDDRAA